MSWQVEVLFLYKSAFFPPNKNKELLKKIFPNYLSIHDLLLDSSAIQCTMQGQESDVG